MGHESRPWQVQSTYLDKREEKGKYRKEKKTSEKRGDEDYAFTPRSRATMGP